jgi:fusion and transport protein UGO1
MNDFNPRDWEQLQRLISRIPNQNPYILYALTKYTSILMTCPFENALTLKQVQFMPKLIEEETALDDELDSTTIIQDPIKETTDPDGYLLRMRITNDPTLPSYQLSSIEEKGTFSINSKIMEMKDEGLLSLWKGSNAYIMRVLMNPLIQHSIQSLLIRFDDTPMVEVESVYTRFPILLMSHFLTGLCTSPLELIQTRYHKITRMVVQTSKKGKRKYKSTTDAFTTILQEEFPQDPLGLITSPQLFIPSLIYHSLNPIFQHSTPIVFDRLFGATPDDSLLFVTTEFTISLLELMVMLPIDTVRKRMQCQVIRKTPLTERERDFEGLVELDPIPYTSMLDCFYRIVTEDNKFKISRLYRGFKVRLATNITIAILQLLTKTIDRE